MRRRLRVTAAVVVLAAVLTGFAPVVASAAPAGSQDGSTTSTTEAPPAPNIIPRPNQGAEPTEAGDRGGALQTTLFVLIIGGIGLIGFFIVRESRRARADRGF